MWCIRAGLHVCTSTTLDHRQEVILYVAILPFIKYITYNAYTKMPQKINKNNNNIIIINIIIIIIIINNNNCWLLPWAQKPAP